MYIHFILILMKILSLNSNNKLISNNLNNSEMKQILILAVIAVLAVTNCSAQSNVNAGVGLAPLGAIQFTGKYAYQIDDTNLQVGAFVAYGNYTSNTSVSIYNYKSSYTTTSAGGLIRYVFNNNSFQPYVGLGLGVSSIAYSLSTTGLTKPITSTGTILYYNPHAGFNFFFGDNFHAFLEGGFGSAYINAGVGTKF